MTTATMIQTVVSALWSVFLMQVLVKALQEAYQIRLYAIENYGRIIHEFDPYVSRGNLYPVLLILTSFAVQLQSN